MQLEEELHRLRHDRSGGDSEVEQLRAMLSDRGAEIVRLKKENSFQASLLYRRSSSTATLAAPSLSVEHTPEDKWASTKNDQPALRSIKKSSMSDTLAKTAIVADQVHGGMSLVDKLRMAQGAHDSIGAGSAAFVL